MLQKSKLVLCNPLPIRPSFLGTPTMNKLYNQGRFVKSFQFDWMGVFCGNTFN
jgi:hypothetical protein